MASLNKVQLIGNLGRDPEVRYLPDGTPTTTVSIATSEAWKDKSTNERVESTEWHRVVFFRGLAEIVGQYLVQGATIYVEGKLKTRKYTDKDGIERYTTEVRASELIMLGGKRKEGAGEPPTGKHTSPSDDDDIPF